jgi:hypothetical protein
VSQLAPYPGFGAQLHDYSPGVAENGLFWTLPAPREAVRFDPDLQTGSYRATDLAVKDGFFVANSVAGAYTLPGTVSFEVGRRPVRRNRCATRPTGSSVSSAPLGRPLFGRPAPVNPASFRRRPAHPPAFPHRNPGYSLLIAAQWLDPADTDRHITWARETFRALRPHLTDRCYVNNLSADDRGSVAQVYGSNYDRLVTIKRRYDPENVFRLNRNIDPSG